MTDPRMTPTNGAPVAVEQCDRDAAWNAIHAYRPKDHLWKRRVASGEADDGAMVQAFARHRLAALASAPAGDGVEEAVARAICRETLTYRGIAELRYADQIVDDEWEDYLSHARAAILAAALARPRAAVGEREAIARLIWEDRHPTGTNWDDWERHVAVNGGFDGRDSCRKLADAILALQSPPAKVEGE